MSLTRTYLFSIVDAAIRRHGKACKVKDKLALYIKEYCKEKKIDLKKQLPSGTRKEIIPAFEKKSKLKVPSLYCWQIAVSIARDGYSTMGENKGGLSTTYTQSCRAQVNGMNDQGFVETFPNGKEGARQFCDKYFKSKDVMDEYFRLLGTGLDPVEAFRDMDNVMSKNKATKIVLSVFHEFLQIDYTQINDDNAHEILDKVSEFVGRSIVSDVYNSPLLLVFACCVVEDCRRCSNR